MYQFANNNMYVHLGVKNVISDVFNSKKAAIRERKAPGCNHGWRLSRWWHFGRLSTSGNFPFFEKWGIHFFLKISPAPLVFLFSTPYPVKSSILHSHDSIYTLNNQIKIWSKWRSVTGLSNTHNDILLCKLWMFVQSIFLDSWFY